MLSVIDDGHGMHHTDIVRMVSFGHKLPNEGKQDHIGRFGIGFKVCEFSSEYLTGTKLVWLYPGPVCIYQHW